MIAYCTETALYNQLSMYYKANQKERRMMLKGIFTSDANTIPDYKNRQLTIKFHSLSTSRTNDAVKKYVAFKRYQTCFPYTDLTLVYKTVEP